ncbi:bactofilin family protein [Novosphingobium aerophilum]|uniref:bactofilin family protein n=1 Tax=Novosphingobium TaxID=165696 RepID=UPI0006C8609E|nr:MULTISPECIES: polymer-forming cytoskeletal protein [unclassified Novosphingobium]KPH57659.1 cell shape determination protein CcmA [Novosphingobium sp. ST904]MPS67540.1 polymer-forming cytoskeletal protein [Novosphingobium sp.]WRT93197.1 polymer-forming cytoskeletal protein [Novosphingobium sp. RL4]
MAKTFTSTRNGSASGFSMLGNDITLTGNIEASADLHVDGRVIGDISCKALIQGEDSEIAGGISAETVRIAGTVRGTIAAREVVILKSAQIIGDVAYDALTIEQGARLEGRLSPNGGQMPPAIAQLPNRISDAEVIVAAE